MAKEGLTADGERIFRELDKLAKMMVNIGFQQGDAKEDNGVDICDIAAFNELGTVRSPSRPFLTYSVDNNEDKISKFMQSKINEIINGKTAEQVLKEIGNFQKGIVQETIVESELYAPNSPKTIKRKGSSTPLVDTGRMRQSVNFVIKKKGS